MMKEARTLDQITREELDAVRSEYIRKGDKLQKLIATGTRPSTLVVDEIELKYNGSLWVNCYHRDGSCGQVAFSDLKAEYIKVQDFCPKALQSYGANTKFTYLL